MREKHLGFPISAASLRAFLLAGLATIALAAPAPVANAETLTTTSETPISIPVSEAASPYPGSLVVEGADGNTLDVDVTITLSHTSPDDLDVVLVSPDGHSEVIMSDACGSGDLANTTLTLDEQASGPLPNEGPCPSGTYKATNVDDGTDVWSSPGPGSPSSAHPSNFFDHFPNGTWRLFVVDDVPSEDGGSIANWGLTIKTKTAKVVVPGTGTSGTASPYPSTQSFNTQPGEVISGVRFVSPEIGHFSPDDIDMLLVGAQGQSTVLMSDTCGSALFFQEIFAFKDEASKALHDDAECSGGNSRPSDFGDPGQDAWPWPAPTGPHGQTLSVFNGLQGEDWKLFVVDDAVGNTGFLSNWTVQVNTRDAADTGFTATSVRVEEGDKALLEVKRTGQASLGPATLNVTTGGTASPGADFTAPAVLEFARGEASKTIEIPIVDDEVGEATERFNVVLSSPRDDARLVGTTSTEVVIGPDNEIKFGKLKRNAKKGTARLFVTLPGPGQLTTRSKGVKRIDKQFQKGGQVALLLKPKGKALNKLGDEGSVKVSLEVTFTPVDGSALTTTKKAKLVLDD